MNYKIIFVLLFCVILILEVVGVFLIYDNELVKEGINKKEVMNRIKNLTFVNMEDNINMIKYSLNRTASINEVFGLYVTREEYQRSILYDDYPLKNSLRSYFWLPNLKTEIVNNYTNFIRETSYKNYTLKKLNGTLNGLEGIKSLNNSRYVPITYSAPELSKNITDFLMGLDMFSMKGLRVYIDDIDYNGGDYTLSNKSAQLSQDENIYGVTLSKVSCKGVLPCDEKDIIGYHMVLINLKDLVLMSLPKLNFNKKLVQLGIYNKLINGTLEELYLDNLENIIENINNEIIFDMKILDRVWEIHIYLDDNYVESIGSSQPLIFLMGSFFVFIFKIEARNMKKFLLKIRYRNIYNLKTSYNRLKLYLTKNYPIKLFISIINKKIVKRKLV